MTVPDEERHALVREQGHTEVVAIVVRNSESLIRFYNQTFGHSEQALRDNNEWARSGFPHGKMALLLMAVNTTCDFTAEDTKYDSAKHHLSLQYQRRENAAQRNYMTHPIMIDWTDQRLTVSAEPKPATILRPEFGKKKPKEPDPV